MWGRAILLIVFDQMRSCNPTGAESLILNYHSLAKGNAESIDITNPNTTFMVFPSRRVTNENLGLCGPRGAKSCHQHNLLSLIENIHQPNVSPFERLPSSPSVSPHVKPSQTATQSFSTIMADIYKWIRTKRLSSSSNWTRFCLMLKISGWPWTLLRRQSAELRPLILPTTLRNQNNFALSSLHISDVWRS